MNIILLLIGLIIGHGVGLVFGRLWYGYWLWGTYVHTSRPNFIPDAFFKAIDPKIEELNKIRQRLQAHIVEDDEK